MIKSELVESVMRAYPVLYHRDADTAVDAILEAIANALANDNRVEIRGFGAFSAKERRPHVGRNPRTGQSVAVDRKLVPMFRAGKEMREALNPHEVKADRARNTGALGQAVETRDRVARYFTIRR
ncbi:integration host factor subunit beta [Rhizobiales bacterium GAS191]|nr:integration host factor subunit beta [Rhizobiales bacterium GAS191]